MLKAALAALVLPALLVGAYSATTIVSSDPPSTPWVNWGGRSFSKPEELAAWLRARGASYESWAANHPRAAARLEGREPPAPPKPTPVAKTAEQAPPKREAAPAAAPAAPPPVTTSASVASRLVPILLVVIATALIGVAAAPVPLLRAVGAPALVEEHRPELATCGVSIALGMAVAQLLAG